MKVLSGILGILLGIGIVLATLFTVFQAVLYTDDDFLPKRFERYSVKDSIPPMRKEELDRIGVHIMRYLVGKERDLQMEVYINGKSLPFFNEQDIFHMKEVKDIFIGALRFRNVLCFFISVILILSFTKFKHNKNIIFKTTYNSILILFFIQMIIGLFVRINFESFFILFHKMIFSNDKWLFDAETDLMINILPQELFFESAVLIISLYSVFMLIEIFIFYVLSRIKKVDRSY